MSKKKKRQLEAQNEQQLTQPPAGPAPSQPAQPEPAQPQSPADPAQAARDRRYFLIFWALIITAVAVAWILDIMLPNVHEAFIERWTMAALAASLGVLLIAFK